MKSENVIIKRSEEFRKTKILVFCSSERHLVVELVMITPTGMIDELMILIYFFC